MNKKTVCVYVLHNDKKDIDTINIEILEANKIHPGNQFFVLSMHIPEASIGPYSNLVVLLDNQSALETKY